MSCEVNLKKWRSAVKDENPPFSQRMARKSELAMQNGSAGKKISLRTKVVPREYTSIQALFDDYKSRERFNKLPHGIMVDGQATTLFKTFVNFCPARLLPQSEMFAFRLNGWTVLSVCYYNGENHPYYCRYLIVQIIRYDTSRTTPYLVGAVEFFEALDKSMSPTTPNVVLGGQAPIHGMSPNRARDFDQAVAVVDDLERAIRAIQADYEAAKLAVVAYLQRQRKRQKRRGEKPGDEVVAATPA